MDGPQGAVSAGREAVLGAVRRALRRDGADGGADAVTERLVRPRRNTVPARSGLDRAGQIALFVARAEKVETTVARVASKAGVPAAVAAYLKDRNLPAALKRAPDPALDPLPWDTAPMLEISVGVPDGSEATGLTAALAGVAETGTLVFESGSHHPSTLGFLPETHIVVLEAGQIVGPYEDVWDLLRARRGAGAMPRTVNMVTGPSRTGDIEQTILLGAHGPKRLHVVLVDGED